VAGAVVNGARDEILARVRSALADVPPTEGAGDVPVARDYRRGDERPVAELLDLLEERVRDYHAEVRRVALDGVGAAVADACGALGLSRLVVAAGVPDDWRPDGVELVADEPGLSAAALDSLDGALTGCAAAIAETGTLILDGRPLSGRRVITLIPDHHICVVTADQVVGQVPEAIARLAPAVRERRAPVTLISGPSATSDIELSRVEGVHGPRRLIVVIAG
jgi:L-lactate dehydrogenase complex protein LldG